MILPDFEPMLKNTSDLNSMSAVDAEKYPLFKSTAGKIIASLVELDMNTGPWLAGGQVRRVISDLPLTQGDWDIWCADKDQFNRIFEKIKSTYNTRLVFSSQNAITFEVWIRDEKTNEAGTYKIQLIKRIFFDTPESVLDSFDITICQLLTDGYTIKYGLTTKEDLENNRIRLVDPSYDISTKGMFHRILKYVAYGFKPDQELVNRLKLIKPSSEWGDANAY